ncbi:MAG: alpha/beta fold hydrolase [Candidatus Binatia bacterium]
MSGFARQAVERGGPAPSPRHLTPLHPRRSPIAGHRSRRSSARDALAFIEGQAMRVVAETRITTAFSDAVDPVMRGHLIEQVALNDQAAYVRAARAAYAFDVQERLGEIAAPTLVLVGEADRTFPMAWMEAVAERIRGARLVRLAGAGHISNMERPQQFNRAVLDFLGA